MDKQPKALELADFLDHLQGCAEAAAELRRLHQSEKEGWRHADELEQDRKRLHEVNTELVESLKELLFEEETQDNGLTEAVLMSDDEFKKFMRESVRSYELAKEKARAAIAKATGEQQ